MEKKKILVTGGAGFIGSAVIPELQNHGYEIFVIDDLSWGNRNFINVEDDHFFKIDIRDKNKVSKAMNEIRPDWVIHLAAIHFIPYCNQHPFEASEINIKGTINLLEAAKESNTVQKVLFASTAAVYPIIDEAITENHPANPLDIYGLSKMAGEQITKAFHLESGITTINCRFFNAFGPNETNPHLIPEIQKQLIEGKRTIMLGNLEPKRDFIHTSDMARAVRMLLEQFEGGLDTFNLGRGIEYSVLEIVEAFERILGQKITIEQDPNRMRKSDRLHLVADISKLKKATGWEPLIGIDEGIATLIKTSAHG